jgi:hypothetical protein
MAVVWSTTVWSAVAGAVLVGVSPLDSPSDVDDNPV